MKLSRELANAIRGFGESGGSLAEALLAVESSGTREETISNLKLLRAALKLILLAGAGLDEHIEKEIERSQCAVDWPKVLG